MKTLFAAAAWRRSRWAVCAAVIPVLWACNARKLAVPVGEPSQFVKTRFVQSSNRDLDLLFVIDNSLSMERLQAKMQARLPDFIDSLKTMVAGGLPDLHLAIVSSSLGAGAFGDVPGCQPTPPGDDHGAFIHLPACTALKPGATFITASADGAKNNFTGDLTALFTCMASLGDHGCGFESQLLSPMMALQQSLRENDPNFGFLRPDAFFALVMLTNEDDSSVPVDSRLFDPTVISVNDPSGLGGLQPYRQNEFGHLCDGKKLPHLAPPTPVTLNNCVSDEDPDPLYSDLRHEIRVKDFVDFFLGLKPNHPERVLMAAIAGPPTPYIVESKEVQLPTGAESQPTIRHSCMQNSGEYADPAVRINQFLNGFGPNAVFRPICADDFHDAMTAIAKAIESKIVSQCINSTLLTDSETNLPDCEVSERSSAISGPSAASPTRIPACNAETSNFPCWRLFSDAAACPMGKRAQICRDAACDPTDQPQDPRTALYECAVAISEP
jgi:hypothetical protein